MTMFQSPFICHSHRIDNTAKMFETIRSNLQLVGIESPFSFNPRTFLICFALLHGYISSAFYFLFEAESMSEYGLCFYTCCTNTGILAVFAINICKIDNMTKLFQKCEIFIERSMWRIMSSSRFDFNLFNFRIQIFDANDAVQWFGWKYRTSLKALASPTSNNICYWANGGRIFVNCDQLFHSEAWQRFLLFTISNFVRNFSSINEICFRDITKHGLCGFVLFHTKRMPFNWKTLFGYPFAWLMEYATVSSVFLVLCPNICITGCMSWLIIAITKDIQSDLSLLNVPGRSIRSQKRARTSFFRILAFYLHLKELSFCFNIFH